MSIPRTRGAATYAATCEEDEGANEPLPGENDAGFGVSSVTSFECGSTARNGAARHGNRPCAPIRSCHRDETFGKEDEMSTQAIRYQERKSNGSWRYAVLVLVVAIVLAIALAVANGGGAAQTTTGGTGTSVQITGHPGPDTTTIVVPGGPAGGHPLP
jgi:hypothetical protein